MSGTGVSRAGRAIRAVWGAAVVGALVLGSVMVGGSSASGHPALAAAGGAGLQLGPSTLEPSAWPQQPGFMWNVGDGTVTETLPLTRPGATKHPMVTFMWTLPANVPAAGAKGKLTITATAGDQDVLAPAFSINGPVVHCTAITNTPSYGTGCADGDHAAVGVSLQPNETKTVTQEFLIQGNPGKVTIVTTAPQNVVYSYTAGSSSGGNAPPPPVVVPTPTGFDQTVTAAEPQPGGTAVITSPALALAGAVTAPSTVTVDISGLSVRDQVIANARHSCYVNFTKLIFGLLKATVSDPNGYDKTDPLYNRDYHVEYTITFLTPQLAACLALVDALQQRLYATTAVVAGASCAVTPFTLLTSVSGSTARLRSIRLGDSHPAVRVSCSRQAGKLTITVATRSKHTPLSSIVGSRLRIGLVRSPKDTSGGQLSVAFHHP